MKEECEREFFTNFYLFYLLYLLYLLYLVTRNMCSKRIGFVIRECV